MLRIRQVKMGTMRKFSCKGRIAAFVPNGLTDTIHIHLSARRLV